MKKELHIIILMLATINFGLTSCSDDDAEKTPLDITSITEGTKTVSSISFSWTPVAGATQYAYELSDAEGTVVLGGTTNATSLVATGLKVNSTYTLNVWAYADVSGNRTTSPVASFTATTNDVVQLRQPYVTWEQNSSGILLTWEDIENATSYRIWWTADGESGYDETTTNSYTIQGLPIGTHSVTVQACTDNENYSDSEPFSLDVTRSKAEIWSTDAIYYSEALAQSFNCKIACFEDGSYEIQNIYGSGEKLDFAVDETSVIDGVPEIYFTNAYKVNAPYYYFNAGDYTLCIYYTKGSGYSGWENGDKNNGEVWFYSYVYDKDGNYLGGGFDDITWNNEANRVKRKK